MRLPTLFSIVILVAVSCGIRESRKDRKDKKVNQDSSSNAQQTNLQTFELDGLKYKRVYFQVRASYLGQGCEVNPWLDNLPPAVEECRANSAFGQQLKKYAFCTDVAQASGVENMPCDIAKEAAVFLNNHLKFAADGPSPLLDDVKLICDAGACSSDVELEDYCSFHTRCASNESCTEIGRMDTDSEKTKIAQCLNELYGIK